jgi:hypothetical protein
MRKIWFLIFFSLIFSLSFIVFSVKTYALVGDPSASSSSDIGKEVNYELPYPGLLPDSPLYFLRAIRDKTIGFLISDPLKKAQFNLLQSDKRFNAGIYLFNKGKISLALSTISKAENYFSESIDKIGEAKTQKKSISEIKEKLKDALGKYKQEMKNMIKKVNKDNKQNFENELKRMSFFEQRLSY